MRPRTLVLALALVLVLGSACGYRLVRTDGTGSQRRVAIQTLRNNSFEPGLEFLISDALQREFMRRGAVRLVDDPAAADWVIAGAVLPVLSASRSFSSVQFALEYQLTLRLDLQVKGPGGEALALDPRLLAESELYLASPDVEVTRKNRNEALRRLAAVLASRLHDTLFDTARW